LEPKANGIGDEKEKALIKHDTEAAFEKLIEFSKPLETLGTKTGALWNRPPVLHCHHKCMK
jgi:hypothetical protein